jgi:HSP20 family protein
MVENGVLVLSGQRRLEKEDKNRKYERVERSYGSFVRSFSLPDNADSDKVNAEFKEGVLKLHIPKSESARPRQIEVKIS